MIRDETLREFPESRTKYDTANRPNWEILKPIMTSIHPPMMIFLVNRLNVTDLASHLLALMLTVLI